MLKIQYTLRFDNETHNKMKIIATKKYRSLRNLIEHIIIEYINSYEKEYGKINLPNETFIKNWPCWIKKEMETVKISIFFFIKWIHN